MSPLRDGVKRYLDDNGARLLDIVVCAVASRLSGQIWLDSTLVHCHWPAVLGRWERFGAGACAMEYP